MQCWRFGEKGIVIRVRTRPPAFNRVNAELVELTRYGELVGDSEIDAACLSAIAQAGIIEVNALTHAVRSRGQLWGHLRDAHWSNARWGAHRRHHPGCHRCA